MRNILLVVLCGVLLGACETGPQVRTDYDREADFSRYRTFNFVEEPTENRDGYDTLLGKYIRDAATAEMQQRGYTLADQPDLLLNYSTRFEDKQTVTTFRNLRPYYGYRNSRYRTWVGYRWETDAITNEYTQGTFNIDMVDRTRNQLVWEGLAIGTVSQEDRENREKAVKEAVASIFARYPFSASGQPAQ